MRFQSSLSDSSGAGHLVSDLLESPKFRKIAVSAVICLVVALASAMSDFRNSVFATFGLGGAFSDPPPERPLLGSTASPDRGGSSSWSLDYLVEANASFIEAAKRKFLYRIIQPKVQPAPASAPTENPANAIANGLNWGGPAEAGGIVQRMQQVGQNSQGMRRAGGLPQGFQHPVVGQASSGAQAQSAFPPLPPIPHATNSVAVAAVPTAAVPPQPVSSHSQPAAYSSHPTARAVVGGRFQSGYSSGQAVRSHIDQTYSYGP